MMISRNNPFEAETDDELVERNLRGTFEKVRLEKQSLTSSVIEDLMEKMLLVDVDKRPKASQLLPMIQQTIS